MPTFLSRSSVQSRSLGMTPSAAVEAHNRPTARFLGSLLRFICPVCASSCFRFLPARLTSFPHFLALPCSAYPCRSAPIPLPMAHLLSLAILLPWHPPWSCRSAGLVLHDSGSPSLLCLPCRPLAASALALVFRVNVRTLRVNVALSLSAC